MEEGGNQPWLEGWGRSVPAMRQELGKRDEFRGKGSRGRERGNQESWSPKKRDQEAFC